MSTQPIPDVISKSEAIDPWGKVQQLIARSQDLARFEPAFRANPVSGIGARFAGLNTTSLRRKLLNTDEVQGALAAISATGSIRPIAFQLSHPNNLSLISSGGQTPIKLSDPSKRLAAELLNRMTMPAGSNYYQLRHQWPFRSVLLPTADNSPIT